MKNLSNQLGASRDSQLLPWWKHRWPWFLMSGPLLAALGSGFTIWLAFSKVDPQIHDGVLKQGLKVTISHEIQAKKSEVGGSK